jgi:hypothetical protein
LGISQNISTAYHLQIDGQSERANQRVEQYLHIYTNDHQNNWSLILPIAQFVHNTWPNATTGYTPLELLIGHTPLVNMAKTLDQLPQIAFLFWQPPSRWPLECQLTTVASKIEVLHPILWTFVPLTDNTWSSRDLSHVGLPNHAST